MAFRRLTTRFLLTVLALFVAMTVVSTASLLVAVDGIVGKLGGNWAIERAEVERARIAGALEREAVLAVKLADSPTIKRWILSERNPALRELAFEELESFRRAFRDPNYFVVVDSSRTYYNQPNTGALAVTTLSPKSPADAWYFSTVREGKAFTFNLDYNDLIGQAKVWINCVVRSGGKVIGVAGTGIDISDLIAQLVRVEQTGVRSMLIDSKGAITADRDRSYLEKNAKAGAQGKKITVFDLAGSPEDRARIQALIQDAERGEIESAVVNIAGKSSPTVVAPIPEIGWLAVVSVDAASQLPFADFLPLFALLVASLLAVLVVTGVVMNRVVLRPLAAMTVSARRVASGDFDLVVADGRKDEIGTLAGAFNDMARQVKTYTQGLEVLVRQRTSELTESNEKLLSANRQVMESIRYASLIQNRIGPAEGALAAGLASFSLFHQPRDIVGGDFLYFKEHPEGCLVAAVDCAGHGVPGALMTMMAEASLAMIAERMAFDDPAGVLGELDATIRGSLRQDGEGVGSGFDIGLCACSPRRGTLVYAGAAMPLYVLPPDGRLRTVAGRKKAIGHQARIRPEGFENHRFPTLDHAFFLVTDGYVDQAGGAQSRSFGTLRLASMLTACLGKPLGARCPDWEGAFDSYRGSLPQRDDCLAFGFRV